MVSLNWADLASVLGPSALKTLQRIVKDQAKYADRFGGPVSSNPDMSLLSIDEENIKDAAKLIKSGTFGAGKARNLPVQAAMVGQDAIHRAILKKLGKYVKRSNPRFLATLVSALALIRVEDAQTTTESFVLVREARIAYFAPGNELEYRRRVYNDARSGYIEDIIYTHVEALEAEGKSRSEIEVETNRLLDECLLYNPVNVYVSVTSDDAKVVSDITDRLIHKQFPIIRVFGRGKTWTKVIGLCYQFASANDLSIHVEEQPIGSVPAGCCRIWASQEGRTWIDIERDFERALRDGFNASGLGTKTLVSPQQKIIEDWTANPRT